MSRGLYFKNLLQSICLVSDFLRVMPDLIRHLIKD